MSRSASVDLPAPGGPAMATTKRRRPGGAAEELGRERVDARGHAARAASGGFMAPVMIATASDIE